MTFAIRSTVLNAARRKPCEEDPGAIVEGLEADCGHAHEIDRGRVRRIVGAYLCFWILWVALPDVRRRTSDVGLHPLDAADYDMRRTSATER